MYPITAKVKQKIFYKKFNNHDLQMVPIGQKDGVMIVKGWRFPTFLVTKIKSKDFTVSYIPQSLEGKGL